MDAGLEELVLSGALFNRSNDGEKSPQRSRSVSPTPNTDDELFGSDISRPESPIDAPQAHNSIGMGPGRTGVKGVIRDRAEARARENSKRAQEIAELNAKLEKTALTVRTFKEDEAAKKLEEEEQDAKERYRRRRWRELKERATGGSAGFGHLREIGVHGFVEAVENERPQTWVVVHIYELGLSRCAAVDESLARIARSHVSTKFLRTRASAIGFAVLNSGSGLFDPRAAPARVTDSDEENGSDASPSVNVDVDMLPTVLVYRGGQLEHTFIRVDWEAGQGGIQNLLINHGVLPSISFSANPGDSLGLQESDEEYDLDD
ncbi:Phosducin-like protein OS=Bos taurus GN=PDCL PE=2 SV=1 [Rhizoctonia solani AG-1 IB]|uniref:Phosducin-like protein n=1 Tax=Thanatephorus cucumeris (strain AG1-IB / isolate 7/3/14) TaxID=1108050 RepID=A0A0B7FF11_THACB|nr:Phosducin-like protein OS=Bos taurus GN=PDCL PE=2 SV=1 [Rhizoctonia solani AG-1 IB]